MNKIFILGSGRCGTTLMTQLLDSHPDVLTYPIEVTRLYRHYSRIRKTQKSVHDVYRSLKEPIGVNYFGCLRPTNYGRPKFNLESLNCEAFEDYMLHANESVCSFDTFINHFAKAFQASLKLKNKNQVFSYFVLDVTSPFIEYYLEHCPEAKIVFMLRHPIQCINSHKKMFYKTPEHMCRLSRMRYSVSGFLESVVSAFDQINKYHNHPKVHMIRLEDLQRHPQKAMTRLATFLNIRYEESLLQPSLLGKPFQTSLTGDSFDEVKIHTTGSDVSFMTAFEVACVEKFVNCQKFYTLEAQTHDAFEPMSFFDFMKFYDLWPLSQLKVLSNIKTNVIAMRKLWYAWQAYKKFKLTTINNMSWAGAV